MNTNIAQEFLTRCFLPGETVAVLLRTEKPASTTQRIVRLEQVLSPRYLAWLRYRNHQGANVYIAANPLRPGSRKRTKESVAEVRHLYLDIDVNGDKQLAGLRASDAVPSPTVILSTSPGKYQVLWRVAGIDFDHQERVLKLLATTFGGDSACTDRNRVLRLPGFNNHKYDRAYFVVAEYLSNLTHSLDEFRLNGAGLDSLPSPREFERAYTTRKNTPSEHDWSWAIEQLSRGADAVKLTVLLASRRSDKPDPLYYAQRTIDIASARLSLLEGAPIEDVITMLDRRRCTELPAILCSTRAREIATTAQRMIQRSKLATVHHSKENQNAIA